jgi:biopolymer transport protein ExbD
MRIKKQFLRAIAALALLASALPVLGEVTVKLAADGSASVDGRNVTRQELAALAAEEAKRGDEALVVIIAARDVPITAVSTVMNTCRRAGVNRFSIKSDEKE